MHHYLPRSNEVRFKMPSSTEQELLLPKEEIEDSKNVIQNNNEENLQNTDKQKFTPKQSKSTKRKRIEVYGEEEEDDIVTNPITDVFLKIIYPLSVSLEKNIIVGVFKSLDFTPGILLNHNGKFVLFSERGWASFIKYMTLVQCYLINKVYGKKTSIRLTDSNIEIENVKIRSSQGIRFRDLTNYNSKVVLNDTEFTVMLAVTPAINRYLEQLTFSGPVIKDYLIDTTYTQPNMQLIYGPIDTSIYNRLPQEVDLYRTIVITNKENSDREEEEEEEKVIKEEDNVNEGGGNGTGINKTE